MIDKSFLERKVSEFFNSRSTNNDYFLIELCMYLEIVFGIHIDDREISMDNIGTPEKLKKYLFIKLGMEKQCAEYAG